MFRNYYGLSAYLDKKVKKKNRYTVNSRYSGHPWDYPKWLEYQGGRISGYLEIPAAIIETVSRASSAACKVIVTGLWLAWLLQ